jgi:hypothetical protein
MMKKESIGKTMENISADVAGSCPRLPFCLKDRPMRTDSANEIGELRPAGQEKPHSAPIEWLVLANNRKQTANTTSL